MTSAKGGLAVVAVAAALGLALAAPASETVPGPIAARVLRIVDGDTLVVRARIWLGQDVETAVRLAGVDAPELHGACPQERDLAVAARALVADAVAAGTVTLRNIRRDKYGGRVLARVGIPGGADLGAVLLAARLARPYHGGRRGGWCARADAVP